MKGKEKNMERSERNLESLKQTTPQTLETAFGILRSHQQELIDYLAEIISSVCDISQEDVFIKRNTALTVYSRWMYWYTYRYVTNQTYSEIAKRTKDSFGVDFTPNGIGQSINKMGKIIESDPMWKKRWAIIKRIIKTKDSEEGKRNNTIEIIVPRKIKDSINIEVKSKEE